MVPKRHFVKLALAAFLLTLSAIPPLHAEPATAAQKLSDQKKLNANLIYQTFFGDDEQIMRLVEQGANPHALNKDGVPALALAATRKTPEGINVIKALLASQVNIDQTDGNGQTALFYAARIGNLDAVKLLLDSGAQYYLTDKEGNIARNIAYTRGYMSVFHYMDNFVNTKRESVLNAYKERAEELANPTLPLPVSKAETEAPAPTPTPPRPIYKKMDGEAFSDAVKQLSFHSCSVQYWYFVKGAHLKTPLTSAELNNEVSKHSKAAKEQTHILKEFGAGKRYLGKIKGPSKQRIYKELESFGSNITRNSHGIGKPEDAKKRCDNIADNWMIQMP